MITELDLSNTTDAQEWAQAFMSIFGQRLPDVDEELMVVWFANATGRAAGEAAMRQG